MGGEGRLSLVDQGQLELVNTHSAPAPLQPVAALVRNQHRQARGRDHPVPLLQPDDLAPVFAGVASAQVGAGQIPQSLALDESDYSAQIGLVIAPMA